MIDSLAFCQKEKGLEVFAWVIMTSHVHLIIGTHKNPMEGILRDFKSFTSRKLCLAIAENPTDPIEFSTNEMIDHRLDHLHHNPVEAGFVSERHEYLYSSARIYAGGWDY